MAASLLTKKKAMRMIPFGAAFPGLIVSTLYFCLSAVEFGISSAGVKGNTALIQSYFAGPLPVISGIKAFLPFTLPSFLVILLKDAYNMLREPKFTCALGILQLITLGIITYSVGKFLVPAIQALDESEASPEQATDLYSATGWMFFLNSVMLISGVVKLYLSATIQSPENKATPASAPPVDKEVKAPADSKKKK